MRGHKLVRKNTPKKRGEIWNKNTGVNMDCLVSSGFTAIFPPNLRSSGSWKKTKLTLDIPKDPLNQQMFYYPGSDPYVFSDLVQNRLLYCYMLTLNHGLNLNGDIIQP